MLMHPLECFLSNLDILASTVGGLFGLGLQPLHRLGSSPQQCLAYFPLNSLSFKLSLHTVFDSVKFRQDSLLEFAAGGLLQAVQHL
jgi:hypothetical protein